MARDVLGVMLLLSSLRYVEELVGLSPHHLFIQGNACTFITCSSKVVLVLAATSGYRYYLYVHHLALRMTVVHSYSFKITLKLSHSCSSNVPEYH